MKFLDKLLVVLKLKKAPKPKRKYVRKASKPPHPEHPPHPHATPAPSPTPAPSQTGVAATSQMFPSIKE